MKLKLNSARPDAARTLGRAPDHGADAKTEDTDLFRVYRPAVNSGLKPR